MSNENEMKWVVYYVDNKNSYFTPICLCDTDFKAHTISDSLNRQSNIFDNYKFLYIYWDWDIPVNGYFHKNEYKCLTLDYGCDGVTNYVSYRPFDDMKLNDIDVGNDLHEQIQNDIEDGK